MDTSSKSYRLFLFTLAAVQFTHIMDFMIMMPLGARLMEAFEINPTQFGMLVSAYTFSAGLVGFFAAFYIDKFDRKKAMLFLYAGFTVGTLACALSESFYVLLLARILTGAFGGITGTLVLALVGDAVPLHKRATAMGIIMSAFSVASVVGVPFGYFLADLWTWQAPFYLIAFLGIFITFFIYKYLPSLTTHMESKDREKKLEILTNIRKDKNRQTALLFTVFLMLGHFAVVPFIAPYMEKNVGFEGTQITLIYLIGGLFTLFTSPIIGKWADKFGHAKLYTIFGALTLIPIFLITQMPPSPIYIALTVTSIFFITSTGRYVPAQTIITSAIKPENRGSFMSINNAVQQLSAGIASYIGGVIIAESATGEILNYDMVGYLAIALSAVALLLGRRIKSIS